MADNGDSTAEDQSEKKISSPVECKVQLLDGSDFEVVVSRNALSSDLVNKVCDHINLSERDYFSCSYTYRNVRFWVNPDREISKAGKKANWTFSFELKFYPLDPTYLQEDTTRYLVFLQLRLDIINGKLPCSFLTQALLGSYAVQSDVGDFNLSEHGKGIEYLRDIRFAEKNSEELLEKIAEIHPTHRGQVPGEAELAYLENAKNVALYGVHMHQARDVATGEEVNIGVCAIGLLIYKEQIREFRYPWAKIMKIAYKRNKFMVDIRGEPDVPAHTKVYKLNNYDMAKRVWRLAIEHHGFFRKKETEALKRAQFPHFGPKFRYSGRTQFQATGGESERPKRTAFTKINRKASTRFTGARALAVSSDAPNFSTDRGEQVIVDAGRTNTLDLKNKMNRSGSIPLVSSSDDNRNLSVIDPGGNYEGKVQINPTGASYTKQTTYQQSGTPTYDQYGNPIFNGDGDYSVDGSTLNSRPYDNMGSMGRDSYGRATDSRYGDGYDSMRNQEDQRLLRGAGGVSAVAGGWSSTGFTSTTKTSTRTYTDSDGTVITEHITEKDGVIEKRIEKRSRNTVNVQEDEEDYDAALLAAIQSVTDMNPDMSVQKIEIHTKTESSA